MWELTFTDRAGTLPQPVAYSRLEKYLDLWMKNESLGINDIQSCERGKFFDVLPVDSSLTLNTLDCNYDVSFLIKLCFYQPKTRNWNYTNLGFTILNDSIKERSAGVVDYRNSNKIKVWCGSWKLSRLLIPPLERLCCYQLSQAGNVITHWRGLKETKRDWQTLTETDRDWTQTFLNKKLGQLILMIDIYNYSPTVH